MSATAPANSPLCAVCQGPLLSAEPRVTCPACQAEYHQDCWEANGGCGVYGCAATPPTEQRRTLEIPAAYWGQEHKQCPACQAAILAAAVRCRHCGTAFASARPEDAQEFDQRTAQRPRQPELRRGVQVLFLGAVISCTAPLAAVFGGIWYARRRRELESLPALYPALAKLGLVVAIGQTLVLALAALAASLRR